MVTRFGSAMRWIPWPMARIITCTRNTVSAPELDPEQPPIRPRISATTIANGPQPLNDPEKNPVPVSTEVRLNSASRKIGSTA